MGWNFGNVFGSSDFGLGSGSDYGSLASDILGGGGNGSNFDLTSSLWNGLGDTAGSSDTGSSWGWLKGLFGGGSGSGGSGGNIWGSLLSGALSGYGQGGMTEAQIKLQGENQIKQTQELGRQQRYGVSYAAQLKDYYDQLDKNRKRTALDTYGQFSLMDRYAPNRTTVAAPQVPNYPTNT